MNENIDLTRILKDCPTGFELYSTVRGKVTFYNIEDGTYPICVLINSSKGTEYFSPSGKLYESYGECTLFPSEDQRDWSKFAAPWYKMDKFNPETLQPFDKVLVRKEQNKIWRCDYFSNYSSEYVYRYLCVGDNYIYCIPYNNETKHLVGTKDEAPIFYRYWED